VRTLLNQVLQQPLPENLQKEIIIVESNSTDGTRQEVQSFCKENSNSPLAEVRLVLQDRPQGKGNAVREGMTYVTGDIILIQDGDLEYDVADYPQLVQPILDHHADFVLGSRHLSAGTWKIRKFEENAFKDLFMNVGGVIFHLFFNLVYSVKLTDPTTMFKVFRTDCIRGVIFEGDRFEFDYELVGKLIRLGFIPLEVPISYRSRGFAEGKKVRILQDPFLWVMAILRFRLCKIRRRPGLSTLNSNSTQTP
jgi:glycosyltransferase involved in cell wall biosynthesis